MPSQPFPIAEAPQSINERHIMRREEVERRTGFKRAHIYNRKRPPDTLLLIRPSPASLAIG